MKILVVEDDKDISTLITFHLKANGFETDTAVNGREAVEKLARENTNLHFWTYFFQNFPESKCLNTYEQ